MNLSLVVEVFTHLQLLAVGLLAQVNALIHVGLARRNVVLQVDDIVLIDQIVHFVVHAFDQVVAYVALPRSEM